MLLTLLKDLNFLSNITLYPLFATQIPPDVSGRVCKYQGSVQRSKSKVSSHWTM